MRIRRLELGDYAKHLGPRFRADGPHSGEDYREKVLVPALEENDRIVVGLDSIIGYTVSFLEEAFGGLVRHLGPGVLDRVQFSAIERRYLVPLILEWMHEEIERQASTPSAVPRTR